MDFHKHLFSGVYHLLKGLRRLNCQGVYNREEELPSTWQVMELYYLKQHKRKINTSSFIFPQPDMSVLFLKFILLLFRKVLIVGAVG